MIEKVIFLDVDGVLCTPLSFRINRILRRPLERESFDPISLFWLHRLVRQTGARLVLSSSWRDMLTIDNPMCKAIMENFFACLKRNHTPLEDVTPPMDNGDKGAEIALWLERNPCGRYIVLDDHNCFSSHPEVAEHWIPVPDSAGLRRREAVQAEKQLNENIFPHFPPGKGAGEKNLP